MTATATTTIPTVHGSSASRRAARMIVVLVIAGVGVAALLVTNRSSDPTPASRITDTSQPMGSADTLARRATATATADASGRGDVGSADSLERRRGAGADDSGHIGSADAAERWAAPR